MIDLLRAMFWTPEAQADAYGWAAVLLAHAMIGAVLTAAGGLWAGAGRAAVAVTLAYALLWEGGQIALAGAGLADSLVDATAVACGAALAAGLWTHGRRRLIAAAAVLAVMLSAGVGRRGKVMERSRRSIRRLRPSQCGRYRGQVSGRSTGKALPFVRSRTNGDINDCR